MAHERRVLRRGVASQINDLEQVPTPQAFYTHFCNHAHRPRPEKMLHLELPWSLNGFFKPLQGAGGGFTSVGVARRFQK
jgi:hypothetical protein